MTRLLFALAVVGAALLAVTPVASAETETVCGAGTEVFSPANPPPVSPVLGPVVVDNVVVPAGNICTMVGTQVLGSVRVEPQGTLQTWNANIRGNVSAQSPRYVDLYASRVGGSYLNRDSTIDNDVCGSTIGGNIELHRPRGNDRIGVGTIVAFCAAVGPVGNTVGGNIKIFGSLGTPTVRGNNIHGELQLFGNRSGVIGQNTVGGNLQYTSNGGGSLTGNTVGGNLQYFENVGGSIIGNTIREDLECDRNTPPPVGAGNVARNKEGQCAAF